MTASVRHVSPSGSAPDRVVDSSSRGTASAPSLRPAGNESGSTYRDDRALTQS